MDDACTKCGRTNVKLWRLHGEFFPPFTLLCLHHAIQAFNTAPNDSVTRVVNISDFAPDGSYPSPWDFGKGRQSWEIGWAVPAVRTAEGDGYWGNPWNHPDDLARWQELPNY